MKFVILTLLYVGVLFIIIGYINSQQVCPTPKIVYRYVPRTFEESQLDPVSVDSIFQNMFLDSSYIASGRKQQVDISDKQAPQGFQDYYTT